MIKVELKKIKKSNVLLLKEPFENKIKDYVIISSNDNTKNLDNIIFQLLKKRIERYFMDKPFSLKEMSKDLLILYNIKINSSKEIDYSNYRLLSDLYHKIKYQELDYFLSFLKGKITKEGQQLMIDKILSLPLNEEIMTKIYSLSRSLKLSHEILTKEIKYMAMKEAINISNNLIEENEVTDNE